jgi:peptide-methionine (R)-S-oxide reductase
MLVKLFRNFTELKMRLSPHEYFVTQGKGIERPFTGEYWWYKDIGNYNCIVCDQSLFPSHYKFFPPTGHCAFFASNENSTVLRNGELECSKCQSHLGYLKDNGPAPTYMHLQVKSAALKFYPKPWFKLPPTRNEQKKMRSKSIKKLKTTN